MRSYYQRLEEHTLDMDRMTHEVIRRCRADLNRASELAEDDMVRTRVAMAWANFRLDELVIAMHRADQLLRQSDTEGNRQRFIAARDELRQYRKETDEMMLTRDTYSHYINSDYQLPDAYRELAKLPLVWKFRFDPDDRGKQDEWYRADLPDEDWKRLSIQEWWETQGYPGRDGYAWYRTRFRLPPEALGKKPLLLYFGAVDDHAWVYLNGELVGSHAIGAIGWDQPFTVPITDRVRPGNEENVLAVRVWDMAGMGGIFRPVWVVTPAGE